MTDADASEIERQAIMLEQQQPDPVVALIGLTGVGKSSTINALFNSGLEVSHFRPCTKLPSPVTGTLAQFTGQGGDIVIYDMPGLGENRTADKEHYRAYLEVLPKADVVVWIVEAGFRAFSPIQVALSHLAKDLGPQQISRIVFAANKVDQMHPGETAWNPRSNLPADEQQRNIKAYVAYATGQIRAEIPGWHDTFVDYSATRRYNLPVLVETMGKAVAFERNWLFGRRLAVADFRELVDPRLLAYAEQMRKNQIGNRETR